MSGEMLLIGAAVFVLLGRCIVSLPARLRDVTFALLNAAALFFFFFYGKPEFSRLRAMITAFFVAYLAMVTVQYLTLRWWARRTDWLAWVAFFTPILFLAIVRYMPIAALARLFSEYVYNVLRNHPEISLAWMFVGISYLAFRTSHLVLEVRNGVVPMPTFSQYVGFAFFSPTMLVGPINPYGLHRRGFSDTDHPAIPVGTALLRVIVGAVKYRYFGPLLNPLTYSGLMLDGHPHVWIDLPIAAVAYYLYLYCNFSGFCDIAIGAAGLMGIPVAENFDNPFAARNMKDFWNRWHITLSQYMRDVVFAPLSKSLVRMFGPANANHAIALTILIVFLIVGVWHGVGWNFALFGLAHAIGVIATHYYTIALKARLGKERFLAYNRSRLIKSIAVAITFVYVTTTLFLFANSIDDMKTIFTMLR